MIDYRKARPMLADLLAGLPHTVAGLLPLVGGLVGGRCAPRTAGARALVGRRNPRPSKLVAEADNLLRYRLGTSCSDMVGALRHRGWAAVRGAHRAGTRSA